MNLLTFDRWVQSERDNNVDRMLVSDMTREQVLANNLAACKQVTYKAKKLRFEHI